MHIFFSYHLFTDTIPSLYSSLEEEEEEEEEEEGRERGEKKKSFL
jgi:hypothetical protein